MTSTPVQPYTFAKANAAFNISITSLFAWVGPPGTPEWSIAVAHCPVGSVNTGGYQTANYPLWQIQACICNPSAGGAPTPSSCPAGVTSGIPGTTAVSTVSCVVNMEGWFTSTIIAQYLGSPPGVALSNSIDFGSYSYTGVVGGGPTAGAAWTVKSGPNSGVIPSYDFTSPSYPTPYTGAPLNLNACCCSQWSGSNCSPSGTNGC